MVAQVATRLRAAAQLSRWQSIAPELATAVLFAVLFWEPLLTLVRDWLSDPEAAHGLLLGPLALVIGWRRGLVRDRRPQAVLGIVILLGAVLLRYVSGLAAELFAMRMSMLGGAAGLVVLWFGWGQLLHWWLPAVLLGLSVPIPEVLLNAIAFPLQLQASKMGAAMLEWRHVPVRLSGNIIQLPGQSLFVTEACSGLRSLTALVALAVLFGGLYLSGVWSRLLLVLATIPIAMAINSFRVFLTGFLTYFLDPSLGRGFMHLTEGWVLFVVAFVVLGGATWLLSRLTARRKASRVNVG